jgi:twitching motility two-component system response regulator PilG
VSHARAQDALRRGIAAAKAQDKAGARQWLRDAVQFDPRCQAAWLWLAGLAEAPLEALRHLERVLALNPEHARARAAARAARLQAGVAAAKVHERALARDLLRQSVADDPGNEIAWMWLSSVEGAPDEAAACLERVLGLNPANEQARASLERYRAQRAASEDAGGAEQPPDPAADAGPDPADEAEDEPWVCPFCAAEDEEVPESCPGCGSLLTTERVEAFQRHEGADAEKLAAFLVEVEADDYTDNFAACYQVGLAYLNLRRYSAALAALREAQRLRPDDQEVGVLVAEVARLAPDAPDPGAGGAGRTVLIADASSAVLKLVSLVLRERGYRVLAAADGYEVIDLLREHGPPNLFLLDTDLPGHDGLRLCRLLRQNDDTARLPVILLDGHDGFLSKVRGRLAGVTGHLAKPFRSEALLRVLACHCPPAHPAAAANGVGE